MADIFTRADYFAGKCTHQQYHEQVARACGPLRIPFTVDQVRAALAAGDEHLNTLRLVQWDQASHMQAHLMRAPLRERGDFYSLGSGVCVLKALARALAREAEGGPNG